MTVRMEDYVNPSAYGVLIWRSIISCALYLEEGLEHWKQRMHKVSTRRCACITQSLRWVGIKLCDSPRYDGMIDIILFV
jgi:hypothetical protein